MTNIVFLEFSFNIKNKIAVKLEDIPNLQLLIQTYRFPSAMFPYDVLYDNPLYRNDITINNLNYINSWTSKIFDNIYSTEELEIINIYLISKIYNSFELLPSIINLISLHINETYEKPEIQFYLEELLYDYVGTLLYNNNQEQVIINNIIDYLKEIEEEHNNFEKILNQKIHVS